MHALILRRANVSRISGQWRDEDYDVFDGDRNDLLADGNIHGPAADRRTVFKAGGAGTNQKRECPGFPGAGRSRGIRGRSWGWMGTLRPRLHVGIGPNASGIRPHRSMTGSTRDEYAIAYSTSRPLEAILRLRIDTGARLKTFGATKRMAGSIAIGRAIRRHALLVSRNHALRRYRKPWTIGTAEKDAGGDCCGYHLRWPSPGHHNPCRRVESAGPASGGMHTMPLMNRINPAPSS
jgi:hypothetical protein